MLETIGLAVEHHGEREAVLAALPDLLGVPLDEDMIEYADFFLAGRV